MSVLINRIIPYVCVLAASALLTACFGSGGSSVASTSSAGGSGTVLTASSGGYIVALAPTGGSSTPNGGGAASSSTFGGGAASASLSGSSGGSNSSTNLDGCWRSDATLTTWCFHGTSATFTTDSIQGIAIGGQQITEMANLSITGSSMSYILVRAAVVGGSMGGNYDNSYPGGFKNGKIYTQPYTYNAAGPSFMAAGDTFVRI